MARRIAILSLLVVGLAGCQPPSQPAAPLVAPPRPQHLLVDLCAGGLLCESATTVDSWRLPQPCQPTRLAQGVFTCWMEGQDWQRVVEFFQSRYPHAVADGPLLRISGQWPQPPSLRPGVPVRTPPLLLAHRRQQAVELVLLAGDPVDMAGIATDTGMANAPSPRRTP